MERIELWLEGFIATGERSKAQFLGAYEVESFEEAVKQYDKEHPGEIKYREGRRPSIWACEVFGTESEARKSFG